MASYDDIPITGYALGRTQKEAMSLGKNYEMAHDSIPEHCNELLAEREEAVRHLGTVANLLCNANFEYNAAVLRIMDINKRINEETS